MFLAVEDATLLCSFEVTSFFLSILLVPTISVYSHRINVQSTALISIFRSHGTGNSLLLIVSLLLYFLIIPVF